MTAFAITTTILSAVILFGFIALGVVKFGWQKSYSTYAHLWKAKIPIRSMCFWSLPTALAAILFAPGALERGASNPAQFLGFFISVYLILVACTPDYLTNEKQRKVHVFGAMACAAVNVLWIIFACHLWWLPLVTLVLVWCGAYWSNTLGKADILWLEIAMFASAYAAVFIG